MHTCFICIGSNYNREENLFFAHTSLKKVFPSICFDIEKETKPIGLNNPALFINQLALFTTELSIGKVTECLKEIERKAGRVIEDKKQEKIVLDIDLIKYDNQWLKPVIAELLPFSILDI